VKRQCSGVAN